MPSEIFSQVLFNDGEGVDPTDFNDVQNLQRAQMWDRFLGELVAPTFVGSGTHDPAVQGPISFAGPFQQSGPPTSEASAMAYAYTPNPGCAMPMVGILGNAQIMITAGTLYQYLGSIDGSTPKFLPFRFKGDATEFVTIANGDPSNPRVDIIQMALSYVNDTTVSRDFKDATTGAVTTTTPTKRRRIQCVLSVKQGTPAASPRYPDPDAGNCVIAGVVVGTNCVHAAFPGFDDAAGAVAVLHDQRMPMRSRSIGVSPSNYLYTAGYSTVAGRPYVQKSTGGGEDLAIPLWAGTCSRLLGASISAFPATPPFTAKWFAESYTNSGPGFSDASFKLAGTGLTFLGSVFSSASVGNLIYHAAHEPVAGPTVLASNGAFVGAPIWTNGRRAPHEPARAGAPNILIGGIVRATGISFRFIAPANGSQFGPTTFVIAAGL